MKKILLLVILFIPYFCNAQLRPEYIKGNKTRIYLANAVIGKGVDTNILNADKIKPALYYITLLNDKYELVPDSAINNALTKLNKPTAFDIAKEVFADRIFIIKLEQLVNIIRVEIISANPNTPDTATTSEGIAVLHLFKKSSGLPHFDPAILTAMQRAFAASEKDSSMFIKQKEPYNVMPVTSIVIAGIEFINNDNYINWEVFNNPLINSFEYTETIYESIYKSQNWVVFDIESRDAIYGLFNLFLIENHIPPSYNELAALQRFNIKHYITGKIERMIDGAKITLYIKENENNTNQKIIKEVNKIVHENNIMLIRTAITELAKKIISN